MTRNPDAITKTLRRVLRRARHAQAAADVRATPDEVRAIRHALMPAALAYARTHERRLPAFVVLCGCRVFIRTTVYGAVVVSPDKDAVPLASSGPMRV